MKKADLVLINGKVLSVKQDGSLIRGEAVAIADGIIAKVGKNEEIESFKGEKTEIIDCHGNSILPGFADVHCHPSIAVSVDDACNLFGIYTDDELDVHGALKIYKDRLRTYVDANQDKKLIRGTGWNIYNFQGTDVWPSRQDIDEICSDKPVVLESFCQHLLWVNTKAMELAGVDKNTPEVEVGKIFREADGFPTGVFKEPEAMAYIKEGVPGYDLSVEEYKESLLRYQKDLANSYGVTMIKDCMHSENARQAYVELAKEGKLTVYARGVYMLEPTKYEEQLPKYVAAKASNNVGRDFRTDTIKIFAEGEFKTIEPYLPEYCREIGLPEGYNGGEMDWSDEVLEEYIRKSNEAGFNVHIHAMADRAVRQSVECIAKAQEGTKKDQRNIIAHLMMVPDESAVDMGRENIIGNVQMRWMVKDGDVIGVANMIGEKLAEESYPLRKLLDNGVTVSAGTDYPVSPPPCVMHEIQCAMTRKVYPDFPDYERYKDNILGTEKPASLEEVLKILTINSAYQIFAEEYTGSLEEGKSAEIVILDSDIEATPVSEIYDIKVHKTIFKGKVVYDNGII